MKHLSVVVERVFATPIANVWAAISDKDEMKKWYFDLPEFKTEVGFEFQFSGGEEGGTQYLHFCKITEVLPGKKLSYSWRFDGYPGNSLVTFELTPVGDAQTKLRITHEGLETFPKMEDFSREKFQEGWTQIVNITLLNYLKNA